MGLGLLVAGGHEDRARLLGHHRAHQLRAQAAGVFIAGRDAAQTATVGIIVVNQDDLHALLAKARDGFVAGLGVFHRHGQQAVKLVAHRSVKLMQHLKLVLLLVHRPGIEIKRAVDKIDLIARVFVDIGLAALPHIIEVERAAPAQLREDDRDIQLFPFEYGSHEIRRIAHLLRRGKDSRRVFSLTPFLPLIARCTLTRENPVLSAISFSVTVDGFILSIGAPSSSERKRFLSFFIINTPLIKIKTF